MPHRPYEDVHVEGHLIDSGIMSQIMDAIVALGGEFETLSFQVGRTNDDVSRAELRISAATQDLLDEIVAAVQPFGVEPLHAVDAALAPAPKDGVFPDGFYATTNLETAVRVGGRWVRVEHPEMDMAVKVDPRVPCAETIALADVRAGDLIVVGHDGIRVRPLERPRSGQVFEFMNSAVSSEKPKAQVIAEIARLLDDVRAQGKDVIAVVGPAVVHTGAVEHLARLVRSGHVTVLFGGNAVAVHDIEAALFGTSLGVLLTDGTPAIGGHDHHLRAINTIRELGGIRQAVDAGVLTRGLMHTLVTTGTPYVLAGSIRDDGPLPDVITDTVEAQRAMRAYCQKAGACIMLSTMLHSIATGNMLPASTTTICVDINAAVVTKLSDRGSFQTIGVVTDVGLFLEQLADDLGA
ncbi:MAG: TIGR00300 family protein [Anaerosomatales bacterium]|nr:TIGR00300 family protein [Anaerosomatales bacterium]